MTPWPFQKVAISELRAHMVKPYQPGILQAPTGSGKSEIMGWIARAAVANGKRVGFIVNRKILVNDLCRRVDRLGIKFGVIMSQDPRRRPWEPVQIASFDTLWRRSSLPKFDLCFVDEAHFSLSQKFVVVIERLVADGCAVIGCTATPVRGFGEGLGSIYKWMVRTPDVPDLIEGGFLVPPRVFAPSTPDLRKIKITGDDYNQKQLAEACDRSAITGDILKHWRKNIQGRPTIAFGINLEHCRHMHELFIGANVRSEYVDHTSTNLDDTWRRLANYETEVVFNCGLAGYGWNVQQVSGMIEGRPTASLALWLQHCGRVLRTHPESGKVDAIINDHTGNALRFGLPDEYRDWPLDCKPKKPSAIGEPNYSVYRCTHCGLVFRRGPVECPRCHTAVPIKYREIKVVDGELEELKRKEQQDQKRDSIEQWASRATDEQKLAKLEEWKKKAKDNGWKQSWAWNTYRRVFGAEPPRVRPDKLPPPPEIRDVLNNWERL